jgi:hypothetical protein
MHEIQRRMYTAHRTYLPPVRERSMGVTLTYWTPSHWCRTTRTHSTREREREQHLVAFRSGWAIESSPRIIDSRAIVDPERVCVPGACVRERTVDPGALPDWRWAKNCVILRCCVLLCCVLLRGAVRSVTVGSVALASSCVQRCVQAKSSATQAQLDPSIAASGVLVFTWTSAGCRQHKHIGRPGPDVHWTIQ